MAQPGFFGKRLACRGWDIGSLSLAECLSRGFKHHSELTDLQKNLETMCYAHFEDVFTETQKT